MSFESGCSAPTQIDDVVRRAHGDIGAAIEVARHVGRTLPLPGSGRTAERWAMLAGLARADVAVARVAEAHCDAVAILAEAGHPAHDLSWGVFASESPDVVLREDGGRLTGTKRWCSLGGRLDAALVTAAVDGGRALFAVELRQPGVKSHPEAGWVARGLPTITSVSLDFDHAEAEQVGGTDWYLTRPGFAWGGMGVAACWYGAALGIADQLRTARPGEIADLHRGRVDLALHSAGCVLADAAGQVDSPTPEGDAWTSALRVRSIVADACETVLRETTHALGPAPLAFDEHFAAQVADLQMYVRQHHGERDVAALGERLR